MTLSIFARICKRPPWCKVSALPVNILTKIRCKVSALPVSIFTKICMRAHKCTVPALPLSIFTMICMRPPKR